AEHRGDMAGATVAWIGDGNNMCHSYINEARLLGFEMRIAVPDGYAPDADILERGEQHVTQCVSDVEAVTDANLVVTDTWTSMGDETSQAARLRAFSGYQVNAELMAHAAADALFMHCLPAHR